MSEANAQAVAVEDAAKAVISLEGDFLRPLSVDLAQFREQPSVVSDPFDLRCYTTSRFIRSVDTYRGVLLKDLILKAGLRPEPPDLFKRTVFIAVAQDGYAVTFSWHELFNTPVGERVIVAYECGGRAISTEEGAPILFSGADILAAPRHVKRLARIVARVLTV
jgi:DMSO/TMAO reductase YedYZ molybdopterin-dependent catalytic subunit